jgi:hypothetical protein
VAGKSFNEVVKDIKSGIGMVEWKQESPDVMDALFAGMFDEDGKLRRHPENGNPLTFDEIWTRLFQMDEELPPGENNGHDIVCRHLREYLKQKMPDKTPQELREGFRKAFEAMYYIYRRGALSNKQFVGTSASRLEDIKAHGIAPEWTTPKKDMAIVWLTEETPWTAEGCHPWSGCDDESEDDESEERKSVKGLILEVDFSQLEEIDRSERLQRDENNGLEYSRIKLLSDGSISYIGRAIPWSAVTRYAILDWEKIDGDWEHFVTHCMPGSPENAVFTRWVMGYPVTVEDMVWPLQHGYMAEDTSPESNRAWTRYLWGARPDMPQDGFDDPDHESTVDACPIEDRKWFIEDKTELLKNRNGITVTVIRDTLWSTITEQKKAA